MCRKHGILDETFWRLKYGGLEVSEARRLKTLEEGEREAEAASGGERDGRLDAQGPSGKKLVTPDLWREAVTWEIQDRDYSQRQACRLIGIDPKT